MNDLTNIIAKFLPIGVIAGLFAVFYLLDVFSVRPSSDSVSTTRASVARPASTSGKPASSPPATRRIELPANEAVSSVPPLAAPTGAAFAPVDAQNESAMEINVPPLPSQEASSPQQMAPRYVPPGGNVEQPLTMDPSAGDAAVQMPSDEITQDEAARIEAEMQREMNELDSAAAVPGQVEDRE